VIGGFGAYLASYTIGTLIKSYRLFFSAYQAIKTLMP
jgi:hypothetical protein